MRMNKRIKVIISIVILFIINIDIVANAYSLVTAPESIILNTKNEVVGKVLYEDMNRNKNQKFYMEAKEIIEEGMGNVAYCLEIEKHYPAREEFNLIGDPTEVVQHIVASGYPNMTASKLNLDTDKDAYFATQIAIWCYLEGYDVYKLRSENLAIVSAIRNIYRDGINGVAKTTSFDFKEYYTNDDVQNIVVAFKRQEEAKLPIVDNSYNGK